MLNPDGGKSGKSPRRRAASMDNNSKFAKSRGRAAKKKVRYILKTSSTSLLTAASSERPSVSLEISSHLLRSFSTSTSYSVHVSLEHPLQYPQHFLKTSTTSPQIIHHIPQNIHHIFSEHPPHPLRKLSTSPQYIVHIS